LIELIEGLPDGVVGLEAVGEVTADDYSSVAYPAVKDALARHKKISLLHVLGDRFAGYEAGGGWADAKLGVLHAFSFKRIAVVTDLEPVRKQVKRVGWLVPGEMKLFSNAQRTAALAWVSADSQDKGGDRG
jgi:SpoIIAA-like